MAAIYDAREYSYNLEDQPLPDDYPPYFRNFRGILIDNRRHEVINCDVYDADPLVDDLSVISAWGTGEGLSYRGQWGIVTNRCQYGSYRGERDPYGNYPVIIRKNIVDYPEHGELISRFEGLNSKVTFSYSVCPWNAVQKCPTQIFGVR